MRKGIDQNHLTYLDAARAAEGAGVAAIALHGRTASEFYSGHADWDAIATLKETITSVPVLGNGDIWSADDAIRMVRETGCDGVVVGRGCLGRPWLFGDLAAAFRAEAGEISREEAAAAVARPPLGFVMDAMRRHTELLVEFFGAEDGRGDEDRACRDIRKHVAWYFKGYGVGGDTRRALAAVESLAQMDEIFGTMDASMPYPGEGAEGQRGRAGSPKRVALPDGWLTSRTSEGVDYSELVEAERQGLGGDGG
jgi:tRNA-dihydrouridine synthase